MEETLQRVAKEYQPRPDTHIQYGVSVADWGYIFVKSARIERDLAGRPIVVVEYSEARGNTLVEGRAYYSIGIGSYYSPPSGSPIDYAAWMKAQEYLTGLRLRLIR